MTLIQRLPQDVINRIAAGEVVQRPSAALKELLENSLDAGSTSIQVSAQDGGLEMLQVCDDGSGIHVDDLPLLCERYATSKLRNFDDLQSITSFGFRGEALASLSYVAKVTVTTKSRNASTPRPPSTDLSSSGTVAAASLRHQAHVGWRATYLDGQLTQPAQACAGNYGTVIRAERMFYNAAVRRGALRPSEEWSRVVDVVSRYALAFPHVGFSCTRDGAAGHQNGVVFPKQSDTLKNIRISHGNAVASHLHPIYHYDESTTVDAHVPPPSPVTRGHADAFARVASAAKGVQALRGSQGEGMFTVSGFASDSTLLNRKSYLCLFINNRLVESYAIRKCMDSVYSGVLTGGNKPFVVLFVTVPSERLDVNVHPTKKEVCLLDEELILAKLAELLRACVLQAANVRQLDMLKLQNTTAAALKAFHPNMRQGPSATSSASAQQTLGMLSRQSGVGPRDETVVPQQGSTPTSSSAEILSVLHSRAARGVAPSPLTSSSSANNSTTGGGASSTGVLAGFGKGNGGVVIAPCTVVRVEPQKGALDAFFSRPKPPNTPVTTTFTLHPPSSSSSPAASSSPVGPKTEEIHADANGDDGGETTPREGCAAQDWQRVLDSIRPAGAAVEMSGTPATNLAKDEVTAKAVENKEGDADTTTPMTATPAATIPLIAALCDNDEEEVDEDRDALMRDFKQFRERTAQPLEDSTTPFHDVDGPVEMETVQRAGDPSPSAAMATTDTVIGVPDVETHVLTSVVAVVEGLQLRSSAAAQAFFQHLALVGLVDANAFMAQSGTSLYLIDTLRLVREVTFQRFFLRWADPGLPRMPSLVLATPQPIEALLLFALEHDAVGMETAGVPPPSSLREAALSAQKEKLSLSRKRLRETGSDALEGTTAEGHKGPSRQPTLDDLLLAAACPPAGRGEPPPPQSLRDFVTSENPTEHDDMASVTYTQLAASLFTTRENLNKVSQSDVTGQGSAPRRVPTRSAHRYVRSLSRRLRLWRDMLSEYFGVVLSAQGEVVALPYVLNIAWPPNLRALPLLLWLLAEAVQYPSATTATSTMAEAETETTQRGATTSDASLDLCDQPRTSSLSLASPWESSTASLGAGESGMTQEASEAARAVEEEVQCFTAIAKHISDTLYGLTSLPMTAPASTGSATTTNGAAPHAPANNTATWITAASPAMPVVTAQEGIDMALMPCLKSKRLFYPPAVLLNDGTVQSIVSVESLYKVFERC